MANLCYYCLCQNEKNNTIHSKCKTKDGRVTREVEVTWQNKGCQASLQIETSTGETTQEKILLTSPISWQEKAHIINEINKIKA